MPNQSRQLAAIIPPLSGTDIVGYTALMGHDEQKAFELLRKNRALQKPIIEQYHGRWIKELGDGVLASFISGMRFSKDNMYQIAETYVFLGEKDKSFEYLEKSYRNLEGRLTYLKGDPLLKNLEGDPRHTALLKKMNLPVD